MADRCIKCNRPLTDPRSKRARVGTKCIRIYGTQQQRVPNPDYERWRARKSEADARYAATKAQADAEYARAMEAYSIARSQRSQRGTDGTGVQ